MINSEIAELRFFSREVMNLNVRNLKKVVTEDNDPFKTPIDLKNNVLIKIEKEPDCKKAQDNYIAEFTKFRRFADLNPRSEKHIHLFAVGILFGLGVFLTAKVSLIVGTVILIPSSIALVIFLRLFCKLRSLRRSCQKAWRQLARDFAINHVIQCRKICLQKCQENPTWSKQMKILVASRIANKFIRNGNIEEALKEVAKPVLINELEDQEDNPDAVEAVKNELLVARKMLKEDAQKVDNGEIIER